MQTIFVLVKCDLGKAYDVAAAAIDRFEEVSEVYSIAGEYDLIVKCHLGQEADIGHFMNEKLHAVPGIKGTIKIGRPEFSRIDSTRSPTPSPRRPARAAPSSIGFRKISAAPSPGPFT